MLRLSLKNLSQQIVLSLILFFTLFILLALTDKLNYNQNTLFQNNIKIAVTQQFIESLCFIKTPSFICKLFKNLDFYFFLLLLFT